jgi:ATP-dependent RNA helicase DHX37/DHR1
MYILPLYSLMSPDKQMRVFDPPPEGHRLVIVSTNVAETSLTIPGIRYVVDCGRSKERHYDTASGMQSFQVGWISKASASQRAGRAGRTGPGHCYRLYSSPVYERYLADHAIPEILRIPIESMVLQMKSINIDVVSNFPFPTPPDRLALMKAEETLIHLGALQKRNPKSKEAASSTITDLGKAMSLFPLSPRYSKMLVSGQQHGCLPYVIALVCALTVGDPFLREDLIGVTDEGDDALDGLGLETAEIANLRDPEIRAKELRKLERRKYFQSQQVRVSGHFACDVV